MTYEYSENDRFVHPHSYMYTQYGGKDFLNEYYLSRKKCREKIKDILKSEYAGLNQGTFLSECLDDIIDLSSASPADFRSAIYKLLKESEPISVCNEREIRKFFDDLEGRESIDTLDLFREITCLMLLCNESDIPLFYDVLSQFINKYEVFKKIFSAYSVHAGKFRKSGNEFMRPGYYILLSFCALYYYDKTHNLKFLNSALKINDALCSVAGSIEDTKEYAILYISLMKERDAIQRLMVKKEVSL